MGIDKETKIKAQRIIQQAEGCRLQVYLDSLGKPTIGIGHLLREGEKFSKISKEQAHQIFIRDVEDSIQIVYNIYGQQTFKNLSPSRQCVLLDLAFNLGNKLKDFKKMNNAIKNNDFNTASYELLNSHYFEQVKSRALRNALILKNNKIVSREQAIDICLHNNVIKRTKQNKIQYNNNSANIKNILNDNTSLKNNSELQKQVNKIKDANIGGVSFDIDLVGTSLDGVVADGNGIKLLEGNLYDATNYTFMDLVTPLKIMYDPEITSKNMSVSLDPLVPTEPEGPWYVKTFYPLQMAKTSYGEAMIQADHLMKQLSLGVNQNNEPYSYPARLTEMGLNINQIFKSVTITNYEGARTRLWIVIKDYELAMNQSFFQVKNIKMGVQLKALQISENGSLRDCNFQPSPIAKKFCQIFTQNYDELCEFYPIFNKMKRLAKASIIAKLMYLKRVPVNLKLITKLHENQKLQVQQRIPRLQNQLKKQLEDRIIQMQVLGGCSFDVANIQAKINEVQKEIRSLRAIYEQKKKLQNTNTKNGNNSYSIHDKQNIPTNIPLKMYSEGIGHFTFVTNQQDIIKNSTSYPFIFQQFVECKYCNKICNSDYYSIQNRQCINHATMKCQICSKLIIVGQQYKSNSDKSMIFHDNCLKCNGCSKKIEGQFANIDDKRYHSQCVPKKLVGKCAQCKKQIFQGQSYAQNPQTSDYYHGECAQIVNKRIQDSIPTCKECHIKISGRYAKLGSDSYHEECAKKKFNVK